MKHAISEDSIEYKQIISLILSDKLFPIGVTEVEAKSDLQYGVYQYEDKLYAVKFVLKDHWVKASWVMEVAEDEVIKFGNTESKVEVKKRLALEEEVRVKNMRVEIQFEKKGELKFEEKSLVDSKSKMAVKKFNPKVEVQMSENVKPATPVITPDTTAPVAKKRGRPAGSKNGTPAKVKSSVKGGTDATGKTYRKMDADTKRKILSEVESAGWGKKGEILKKYEVTAAHLVSWRKQLK